METLTMVIIEDEKIILEELVSTFDWSKLGITVIGTA